MTLETAILVASNRVVWRFVALFLCGSMLWVGSSSAQQGGENAEGPAFSVAGGVFTNVVTLSLKGKSESASIRYTLDGTEPSEKSPVYEAAIRITNSVLVRARLFENARPSGQTVSQTYVLAEPDLFGF